MSDGSLVIRSLVFLLVVGLFSPFFISWFVDVGSINTDDSLMDPVIDFVDTGVSIFGLEVNPFDLLFGLKSYVIDSLTIFALLPNIVVAVFMILVLMAFIYGLIKLLPTT